MSLFHYSDRVSDGEYEYRTVIVPKDVARKIPGGRLMTENEWRGLGVQQSKGWEHFLIHAPEPHVLVFRRKVLAQPIVVCKDPKSE